MSRPYELYIRFLVTQGIDQCEKANEKIAALSLPPITQEYFKTLHDDTRGRLPKPILEQVFNRVYEGDFLRWMKILDVQELWLGEPHFKKKGRDLAILYGVFKDENIRLAIQALLSRGVTHKDIAALLNGKYAAMLQEADISLFEKHFWNVRRMTRTDWREYMSDCDNNRERHILYTALTESTDVLKTILGLPSKTHVSDMLQDLLSSSYRRAKHYLNSASPTTDKEARAWISETVKLAVHYEKYRTGDVMDFGKELQMEFDYITSDFPTPDEEVLKEVAQMKTGEIKNE